MKAPSPLTSLEAFHDAFRAFQAAPASKRASKTLAKREHAMLRAFVSHSGWVVPAAVVEQGYGVTPVPLAQGLEGPTRMQPGHVWFFTDVESARVAQAASGTVGACVEGILGSDLFTFYEPSWGTILVNPGSSAERTLHLFDALLSTAQAWGRARSIESELARWDGRMGDMVETILAYTEFLVVEHLPSASLEVVDTSDGRWLMAFTAPDCLESYLSDVPAAQRHDHRVHRMSGEQSLSSARDMGLRGIRFNSLGPGPSCSLEISWLG